MKYVSFPWPPLEAALAILTIVSFFIKKNFEKQLIRIKENVINAES